MISPQSIIKVMTRVNLLVKNRCHLRYVNTQAYQPHIRYDTCRTLQMKAGPELFTVDRHKKGVSLSSQFYSVS